jgi:uncharacterized protein
MSDIAFPYRIDARGRTAEVAYATHIRDLIEALLFTTPGERVMRPTFGANLLASVFAPAGAEAAAVLNVLIQSSLQEHLRDLIEVRNVEVTADDSQVTALVTYDILQTGEPRTDSFERGAP